MKANTAPVLISLEELSSLASEWRKTCQSIVLTSGVFDLVHQGHCETLELAASFGDRLVVVLNTDESVRRKKGPKRPINNLAMRLNLIRHLKHVDAVAAFDDESNQPISIIEALKPDYFVKSGGEWNETNFFFRDHIEKYGGRAKIVRHKAGISSTDMIDRIVARYCD